MVITIIVLLLCGLLYRTWSTNDGPEAEQPAESPSPINNAVMQSAAKNAEVHARNHKKIERAAIGYKRARGMGMLYVEPPLLGDGEVIDVEATEVKLLR
jgi:hypothetical protein